MILQYCIDCSREENFNA